MNTEGFREPPSIVFMDGRHNGPAMTEKGAANQVVKAYLVSFFALPRLRVNPTG